MKSLLYLSFLLLFAFHVNAQVGIGTTSPNASSMLDITSTNSGLLIPRIKLLNSTDVFTILTPAPSLLVYNEGGVGFLNPPGYYYWNGVVWLQLATAAAANEWKLTGNAGTTAGTNFIGTTDVQDFVIKTSAVVSTPLERMRVTTAGNVGINAPAPTATALLTINPNTNVIRSGIDMTMTNAASTATGLNITAGNAFVNGISVSNSTASSSGSVYGIGSVLSATNIVSGYNAYRIDGGGTAANAKSYGIYGMSGTNALYNETNASTWAAFLRGRTVISSESSPTSPLGTDLEVRNTTLGAAAPATVSLRQTTSLPTIGNVLANLNFGDNYVTTPQAQIQVRRDAAAGSAADMPTEMTFSTTPDTSGLLTERMRITSAGKVGIGVTAIPKGALEIDSSNDGLVIPRVALLFGANLPQPLAGPTTSEIIYNTATVGAGVNAVTPGFYYWNGASWVRFATGASTGWLTTGNTGIIDGTNFIGTAAATDIDVAFRRNNLASGKISSTSTSLGLNALTSGATSNGTAFGVNALAANTTGANNTAIGTGALAANTASANNTAVGFNALAVNTPSTDSGALNTAVGSGALASLNGGHDNTAVGYNALTACGGLSLYNTAVGSNALKNISAQASRDNVAVGYNALGSTGVTITNSVAVGSNALVSANDNTTRNTAIGNFAGSNITSGNDNVAVGANAQPSAGGTNQIIIGSGVVAGAYQIVLGGTGAAGAAYVHAPSWTTSSDRRLKSDIKDSPLGLDFIKTIRPVSYFRNDDVNKKTEYGFIAQELDLALKNAGSTNNGIVSITPNGMFGVRYNDFLPITVKAVQEQQVEIESLKKANEELMKTNAAILKRLEALENR